MLLDGVEWLARKERNCDHFVGVENSKKRVRSRLKNWPGIRPRFWCLLVLAHFSKAQKTAPFLGLHFGAGEPLSSPFLEPQTERPCLQQCSWVTPDCSQSLLVLNTYSFQTIKLKLSAFLPNAAATGEALVVDTFWKGFSVWKLSPSNRPKTELFGKKSAGRAQPPPEAH